MMRQTWLMLVLIVVVVLSMHFVKLTRAGAERERSFEHLPPLYSDPKTAMAGDDDVEDRFDDPVATDTPVLTAAE